MPHIHTEAGQHDQTISAFILHPTSKQILLIEHKKIPKWLQPGGHIELVENPWAALTHELLEETGLEIDKCELLLQPDQPKPVHENYTTHPIPFHFNTHPMDGEEGHWHTDMSYALRSYSSEIKPGEGESQIWRWISPEELERMRSEGKLSESTYQICKWLFAKPELWPAQK